MNEDSQNPLAECFAAVKKAQAEAKTSGNAERGIQSYFDLVSEAITRLIERPNADIVPIVSSLSSSEIAFLRGISTSGATWSVRNGSWEWLVLGLRGLYLEDQTNDSRETITKLALINHSAKEIGTDISAIADAAFGSVNIDLPQTIADYVANPVQDIESVGYTESTDASGAFCYTRAY